MEKDLKVRLISYSKPARGMYDEGLTDAQELIAFCARVSNPSNQGNDNYAGLLKYCIKHNHWSVFEQSSMSLEIETNRGIAAQILRHRSFTFQEFSQRYADPTKELNFEYREARLQDEKNRQNSISVDDDILQNDWKFHQSRVISAAKEAYTWAVKNGIAKEQARAVLPEGNTVSRLYMNGTLRSWIHYIQLRSANGTQKEHIEIAKKCAEVIAKVFPMANEFVSQ